MRRPARLQPTTAGGRRPIRSAHCCGAPGSTPTTARRSASRSSPWRSSAVSPGSEADLVRALPLGRRLAVVSDATTHGCWARASTTRSRRLARCCPVVLDAHAARRRRDRRAPARARPRTADALVAVGSGTINDLCKYAAASDGKPYVVFATAPSMNGYTSANAAITVDGHKKTLPATSPRWRVHRSRRCSPRRRARMIRAGLGDSLCRSTAQADWSLSRNLLGTPVSPRRRSRCSPTTSRRCSAAPEALIAGDLDAMRALARTLVLSGLGMTICDGSYPASQGEHLISHYIDMFAPGDRPAQFHGEQVAVATLTMARHPGSDARRAAAARRSVVDHARRPCSSDSATSIGASCWREYSVKRLSAAGGRRAFGADRGHAGTRRATRCVEAMITSATLADVMARAGCPRTPGRSVSHRISMRAPCATRASCAIATRSSISPLTPVAWPTSPDGHANVAWRDPGSGLRRRRGTRRCWRCCGARAPCASRRWPRPST